MAEVRKWEILICTGCWAVHDRPDAGCPECKSKSYTRVPVVAERDVQPLVEAAREGLEFIQWHRKGKLLLAKQARLEAALKPFEGTTGLQVAGPGAVDDGSRLQELLEWVEAEAAGCSDHELLHGERTRRTAFKAVASRIHQLQANEEKGGEG